MKAFPILQKIPFIHTKDNIDFNPVIKDYLSKFINDKNLLNEIPFLNIIEGQFIKNNLSDELKTINSILKKLYNQNTEYTEMNNDDFIKKVKLLYLSIYKSAFQYKDNKIISKNFFNENQLEYTLQILETIDISRIREDLEDQLFQKVEPKIFNNYCQLRSYSTQTYFQKEKEIKDAINQQLKFDNLKAIINSRLKSIYSIHKKIVNKNLLFSQILDIIALRIIVNHKKDCYTTMNSLIKTWPVLNSKIKDYITVPKSNGYQSIHLTILYNEHPVEIQIRTHKMHHFAEFGAAAHYIYKNNHA